MIQGIFPGVQPQRQRDLLGVFQGDPQDEVVGDVEQLRLFGGRRHDQRENVEPPASALPAQLLAHLVGVRRPVSVDRLVVRSWNREVYVHGLRAWGK